MLIQRNSVFETNSSSSHSITISPTSNLIKFPIDPETTEIEIKPGEFGWEVESHYDLPTKLSYLYTDAINYQGTRENWCIDQLKKVILDNLGINLVFKLDEEDDWNKGKGYIDHQSVGMLNGEVWFDNEEQTQKSLFDFLFRENSFLQTDNDNH